MVCKNNQFRKGNQSSSFLEENANTGSILLKALHFSDSLLIKRHKGR